MQIPIIIKILKNQKLIKEKRFFRSNSIEICYPFCIPLRGSFDRLTLNIKIIIKKKKHANAN